VRLAREITSGPSLNQVRSTRQFLAREITAVEICGYPPTELKDRINPVCHTKTRSGHPNRLSTSSCFFKSRC